MAKGKRGGSKMGSTKKMMMGKGPMTPMMSSGKSSGKKKKK
jgi:hypothetical protein